MVCKTSNPPDNTVGSRFDSCPGLNKDIAHTVHQKVIYKSHE